MNREQFLSRVASAVMTSGAPSPSPVPDRLPELDPTDLVALFRSRAQAVDAVVHGPVAKHRIPKAVVGIALGHDCSTFAAWDDLPTPGVATALSAAGLTKVSHQVPNEGRKSHQMGYSNLDLGVTGSVAGLAESGSVVLTHGSGHPRMVSLVPEIHVVLLDVSAIDRTLALWAAKHPDLVGSTANLVLISGPSRTGDIELQLNLGVHGPRHLHIVLSK